MDTPRKYRNMPYNENNWKIAADAIEKVGTHQKKTNLPDLEPQDGLQQWKPPPPQIKLKLK